MKFGPPLALLLWLAWPLSACAAEAPREFAEGRIPLNAASVPLNRSEPDQRRVGALEFLAGFDLTSSAPEFGGISGLQIEPNGQSMTAITDRGHWLRFSLNHDWQGRLTSLGEMAMTPIMDRAGKAVAGSAFSDAEALVADGAGGFLVSFEQRHRIWRYAGPGAVAQPVGAPGGIESLPANRGIEAMAQLRDGRIVMISEGVEREAGWTIGWFGRPGAWADFAIQSRDGFRPTDLAQLPDGRLLLLERYFSLAGGVRARLATFPVDALSPDARIAPAALATLSAPLTIDNFEALAVRPAPDGGSLLIYLLSDDNFNPLQRTLLLQFKLAN